VSRRSSVVIAGTIAIATLAAGLVIGSHVTSPKQAAARARPPTLSEVTAVLERRTLTDELVTRGSLVPGGGARLTVPPALAGPDSVVTSVAVKAGDQLDEGDLIADISGQPLVAARFAFPLYRSLNLGDEGPDVREASELLVRHGNLAQPVSKVDDGFRGAMRSFLSVRGYPGLVTPRGLVLDRRWFLQIDRSGRNITRVGIRVGAVLASTDTVMLECDQTPPFVVALIDQAAAKRMRVGDEAVLTDDQSNRTARAKVVDVSKHLSQDAQTGTSGVRIRVGAVNPNELRGLPGDLRLTVRSRVGDGPLLVAPVTAVYTNASGDSHVTTVSDGAGATTAVAVAVGTCVSGWCQITDPAQHLRAGQRVVVGDEKQNGS